MNFFLFICLQLLFFVFFFSFFFAVNHCLVSFKQFCIYFTFETIFYSNVSVLKKKKKEKPVYFSTIKFFTA